MTDEHVEGPKELAPDLVATADEAYEPILGFDAWSQGIEFTGESWDDLVSRMDEAKESLDADALQAARRVVSRAAAIETGAIERLYDLDEGFTISVALGSAVTAQAVLDAVEGTTRSLIQSQLAGYDFVIDFVTGKRPIAEAWIRELHQVMCAAQETYRVWTEVGWDQRPLPLGKYKEDPNHVVTREGSIHSYAPVHETAPEMGRFVAELRADPFSGAHPVIQAAYAHHTLARIHPFADGNGRVARALASVFTYRSANVPTLVFADQKPEYLAFLREADQGRPGGFVRFVERSVVGAGEVFLEAIRSVRSPQPEGFPERIRSLFVNPLGITHDEVDETGGALLEAAVAAVQTALDELQDSELEAAVSLQSGQAQNEPYRQGYRPPVKKGVHNLLVVGMRTPAPAAANMNRHIRLEIPRECRSESLIYLHDTQGGFEFSVSAREVMPPINERVKMLLRIRMKNFVGEMLRDVYAQAKKSLRESGY